MAIYQPPTRRWRVALATGIVGLIVGTGIGALVLGGSDPDPVGVIRSVDAELEGAAGLLEDVLVVEYAQSVKNARVVSEPEYRGAHSALARARRRYVSVRDAAGAIDPDATQKIDALFDALEEHIADHVAPAEVEKEALQLARFLRGLIGAS